MFVLFLTYLNEPRVTSQILKRIDGVSREITMLFGCINSIDPVQDNAKYIKCVLPFIDRNCWIEISNTAMDLAKITFSIPHSTQINL